MNRETVEKAIGLIRNNKNEKSVKEQRGNPGDSKRTGRIHNFNKTYICPVDNFTNVFTFTQNLFLDKVYVYVCVFLLFLFGKEK